MAPQALPAEALLTRPFARRCPASRAISTNTPESPGPGDRDDRWLARAPARRSRSATAWARTPRRAGRRLDQVGPRERRATQVSAAFQFALADATTASRPAPTAARRRSTFRASPGSAAPPSPTSRTSRAASYFAGITSGLFPTPRACASAASRRSRAASISRRPPSTSSSRRSSPTDRRSRSPDRCSGYNNPVGPKLTDGVFYDPVRTCRTTVTASCCRLRRHAGRDRPSAGRCWCRTASAPHWPRARRLAGAGRKALLVVRDVHGARSSCRGRVPVRSHPAHGHDAHVRATPGRRWPRSSAPINGRRPARRPRTSSSSITSPTRSASSR